MGTASPILFRWGATYVDKILKGAKPGDLSNSPRESIWPSTLGLTFPDELLLRADEVID